jgi:cellulase/cellobiase CelA1
MEQWCWPPLRQHGGSLELGSGRTDGAISEKLKNTNSKIADRRCTNLIVSLTAGGWVTGSLPNSNICYFGDYFLFKLTNA